MWDLESGADWNDDLLRIFDAQTSRFKVNLSHSFVLKHRETGELSFFHASSNNHSVFEQPLLISSKADFLSFLNSLRDYDILESVQKERPSSKYIVLTIPSTSFYFYHLHDFPIGCQCDNLPLFLTDNKHIHTLQNSKYNKTVYKDNLCFFRCLALYQGQSITALDTRTKELYEKWRCVSLQKYTASACTLPSSFSQSQFCGISLMDLDKLEHLFYINIDVFEFQYLHSSSSPVLVPVRRSSYQFNPKNTLRLLKYENHFMYIIDIDKLGHALACHKCHKLWKFQHQLDRHQKTCSGLGTKMKYEGGVFNSPLSPLEELKRYGFDVDTDYVYPFRATFDFEVYFDKSYLPASTSNTSYTATHIPLSVSIASNVPDFEKPMCFITDGDSSKLVSKMVEYLTKISDKAYQLLRKKFSFILKEIEDRKKLLFKKGEVDLDGDQSQDILGIARRFEKYLHQLPCIGFNSGKYDLNVIKPFLFKNLVDVSANEMKEMEADIDEGNHDMEESLFNEDDETRVKNSNQLFVVKRSNDYVCISTPIFKFLDIRNFLAPGYSYSKYLQAFDVEEKKSFFPYEYIDNLEKLNETELPPQDKFYSSLKEEHISDDDYNYCQVLWKRHDMKTLRDFLVHYNNNDVGPFLTALDKQMGVYRKLGVDLLKDGISVPGITLKYLFKTVPRGIFFSLFHSDEEEIHTLLRDQMTGGLSIIFHRYHEKDKTFIRGNVNKAVKSIQGYDANALYLWALSQEMPTEYPVIRCAEDGFKPKRRDLFGRKAREWLEYTSYRESCRIQHKYNDKEKVFNVFHNKYLRVDGYDAVNKTVYEFHGCIYHGHDCRYTSGLTVNPINGKTFEELKANTAEKTRLLRKHVNMKVVEMWECDWDVIRKSPEVDSVLVTLLPPKRSPKYRESSVHTEQGIIKAVEEGRMFGLVKCDLEVPVDRRKHFSEFQPIFKNTLVTKDDIGPHMKEYAEKHKLLQQPRKTLVGSYFGKQIVVATPLLRWYIKNGISVTNVTLVLEYIPNPCFQKFAMNVSDARRSGDIDVSKQIIGETFKLIGNSAYGKTLTNKARHRDYHYVRSGNCSKLINDIRFRKLVDVDDDLVEVEMSKRFVNWDLPLQIGYFVYQYAKLRMLQFHYEFVDHFIDRTDYQLLEMDTDSLYLAISTTSLEEAVKPELRREFYTEWGKWLPSRACNFHKDMFVNNRLKNLPFEMSHECSNCKQRIQYDKRTPGLFKTEFSGDVFIGLCSKTYYCFGEVDGNKLSCKGLNKNCNKLKASDYKSVISNKESGGGVNKGFRFDGKTMHTYTQNRNSLSYFYIKRVVGPDGVTTSPTLV